MQQIYVQHGTNL